MNVQRQELEEIFEKANLQFLRKNLSLFEIQVSERTLCGALMLELHDVLSSTKYADYFVDVEYNRNSGGKLKMYRKTIKGPDERIVAVNCDLIVHSRGQNRRQDNLIALEMKKSSAPGKEKDSDRIRLECLTKSAGNDICSYEGGVKPEHVCGYGLGIYYEINFRKKNIAVEYYADGVLYKQYRLEFKKKRL